MQVLIKTSSSLHEVLMLIVTTPLSDMTTSKSLPHHTFGGAGFWKEDLAPSLAKPYKHSWQGSWVHNELEYIIGHVMKSAES